MQSIKKNFYKIFHIFLRYVHFQNNSKIEVRNKKTEEYQNWDLISLFHSSVVKILLLEVCF